MSRHSTPFSARNMDRGALAGYLFIFPAILAMVALIVYPMLFGVGISFFKTNLSNKWEFLGLVNYLQLFKNSEFVQRILMTFRFTAIVVFFHFVIGGIFALLLYRHGPGTTFFRTVLTLPWLFPEVVVALLFKWIFNPLYGILNNTLLDLGLISENLSWLGSTKYAFICVCFVCIWKGFPLVMINIIAGLQSVSTDLIEAARIDGADGLKVVRYVLIPSIRPVLYATITLDTVWWFKHYTIVWLLTQGGPGNATSIISISVYKEAFEYFNYGEAAAMSVLIFVVCYLISVVYRRVFKDD